MRTIAPIIAPIIASLSLTLVGCGGGDEGPKTYPVSGTVTIDGAPLGNGNITFDVKSGGHPTMGAIADGKFNFEVAAGSYTVRVNAVEETGEKDQYDEPVTVSVVDPAFNVDSTLTADVKESENTFSFDVKRIAE